MTQMLELRRNKMTTPIDALLNAVEWQETSNAEDVAMADDGIPWATHSGVLTIAGTQLRCYRLNTGQAILDADDVAALFGI